VEDAHSTRRSVREPYLEVEEFPDRAVVRVTGEVGVSTRPVWENALRRLDAYGGTVRLELSGLSFSDVAGAGALAVAAQELSEGRRVLLDRPPVSLRRALETFWPDVTALEVVK
jgi:anti-anti-sigma regulatory factor